ncbi:MAG: molybdenum cofactor biosynthesis protein MoaE [Thermoplasmata archaeon]|nr:MAG: molybdenum cofactor biosynthesis protein MoaE [Thermoplasmata archaeon]
MGENGRQSRIEITKQDFDANSIIESLRRDEKGIGALVTFIGTVRDFTEVSAEGSKVEKDVKELLYECYEDMALMKMNEIRNHAMDKYDIYDMSILHRIGVLRPGEQIVIVAVSAAHRKDAFQACEFAIEELKVSVPIWKKEMTKDGDYWVEEDRNKGK